MRYAFTGWNFKIQLCIGAIALLAAFYFPISKIETLAVLLCVGAVLSLEIVNTAIEELANTLHPERSEGIKKTKDLAAGAVLLMSLVSLIVAVLVFYKPVISLF